MLAGRLSDLAKQALEIMEVNKGEAKPTMITLVKHKITDFHADDTGSPRALNREAPRENGDEISRSINESLTNSAYATCSFCAIGDCWLNQVLFHKQ